MAQARRPRKHWKHSRRVQQAMEWVEAPLNRIFKRLGWKLVRRDTILKIGEAAKYEYYWYKAHKRIEIRDIDGFGPLAEKTVAERRTEMRHDRLYTLWQAVAALPAGNSAIAEVGAFKGGSARFIAEALAWHRSSRRFFVCDTFEGHASVDEALDGRHRIGKQFIRTSVEDVAAYLAGLPDITLVKGDFQVTSTQLEPHAPFAFVHIDVDVYPAVRHALGFFAPRLLHGGLAVVDDYGFKTCRGAREAVNEFARAHSDFRLFHLLTGQALLVKVC